MSAPARPHVVVIAPNLDRDDVGETGTSFRLLRAMADIAADTGALRLTVLVLQRPGRVPAAEQLPDVPVVAWPEPAWLLRFERFNAMLKPAIPPFYAKVRRWLRTEVAAGRRIDLVHQMLPRAPRYASPLPGLGLPYIVGPVGGAIPMPPAFRAPGAERWFTRLRDLDGQRFRHDPWLRRGFGEADLVMGVAPYMAEVLADLPIRRFEPFLGIGVDELPPLLPRALMPGEMRLLHVGRAVRTKGLREAVLALALLPDLPGVRLTSVGAGDDIAVARRLAAEAGVEGRVEFLGKQPRARIEALYQSHDALLFPSFRESMGAVFYEAMRWSMPAITVDHGGPGYIVDESCGIRVPLTTPAQLPRDLAAAIRRLATEPGLYPALSRGAHARVEAEALWPAKARRMIALYEGILRGRPERAAP